jgi:hypothetical protein
MAGALGFLDDRSVSSVPSGQDCGHPDNATIQDRDIRERDHKEHLP